MTTVKGRLDRETGAKLRAALEPLAAPQPAQDGEKDPRTPAQRNADALAAVLDIALSTDRFPVPVTNGRISPARGTACNNDSPTTQPPESWKTPTSP
jgi:hypothetical protein